MSDYPSIALIGPDAIGTVIAAVLHDAGRTPLLAAGEWGDGVKYGRGEKRPGRGMPGKSLT